MGQGRQQAYRMVCPCSIKDYVLKVVMYLRHFVAFRCHDHCRANVAFLLLAKNVFEAHTTEGL